MYIYVDEFYNNLNKKTSKLSIELIKNTVNNLKKVNKNFIYSEKIIYFIIYLSKHNCKFKLINHIINKIYTKISCRLSVFLFTSIRNRWIKIINLALLNNVEKSIINYFFELYELYLNKEKCNNMNFKKIQAKYILGINIKNNRQLRKYFNLNIYHTIYYIDIIFSQLHLKYLSLNYIYDINL
jgi:hypothetical protein